MIHGWLSLVTQKHFIFKLEKAQGTPSLTFLLCTCSNWDTDKCSFLSYNMVAELWPKFWPPDTHNALLPLYDTQLLPSIMPLVLMHKIQQKSWVQNRGYNIFDLVLSVYLSSKMHSVLYLNCQVHWFWVVLISTWIKFSDIICKPRK